MPGIPISAEALADLQQIVKEGGRTYSFTFDLRDPEERPELLAKHLGISLDAARELLAEQAARLEKWR